MMTTCDCGATIPVGVPSGLCAWCSAVPYRLPSSADLAAFRYRINPDAYDCEAFSHPTARDWERRGIPGWPPAHIIASGIVREASAMRSRAYERMPDTAATEAAIETYAPTR